MERGFILLEKLESNMEESQGRNPRRETRRRKQGKDHKEMLLTGYESHLLGMTLLHQKGLPISISNKQNIPQKYRQPNLWTQVFSCGSVFSRQLFVNFDIKTHHFKQSPFSFLGFPQDYMLKSQYETMSCFEKPHGLLKLKKNYSPGSF